MTTSLSHGKLWGLRRMADATGRFKMLAVDQRPPIKNPIAKYHGKDQAPYEDVTRFKLMLLEELQSSATAMLLDPHFALPKGMRMIDPANGLIVTLEDSLFGETDGGRTSSEIDNWPVEKIKRVGGDAVKVLAWYRPDASAAVCQAQKDFTKRIGDACAKYDIPFLFELLVYPMAGDAHQTKDYVEMQGKDSAHVLESVAEFAKPDYGVDVFKLESPVGASVAAGNSSMGASAIQDLFDEMGRLSARPWVMLSAGADKPAFKNVLDYAYNAGASGYLAGRAIWLDAFAAYPDWDKIRSGLQANAVPYMQEINALTDAKALPWYNHDLYSGSVGPDFSIDDADAAFRNNYPGF
ncbi:MAG: tagatose 1,6-diphosphate aldolase [Hyphomicrobiales bacterium]